MASTLTTGNLIVKLSESIFLNGKNQGGVQTLSIPRIATFLKRIINIPASDKEILAMSTVVAAGTFIESAVMYIRITNLDDENFVGLIFKNENDDEFTIKLDKGRTFIYNADADGGVVDTMDARNGAAVPRNTFGDLVSVNAQADSAAVDLEVVVACI